MEPTVVLFPSGQTRATAQVAAVHQMADGWAIITDSTPFHPLDHTWPDQPADQGTLAGLEVVDCVTGAYGPDGLLRIGPEIPARRGDPAFTWVVVHMVDRAALPPQAGEHVELQVDAAYRQALSVAHTACHLAALALNEAAATLWRKPAPRTDSLGNPDVDGLAIERSVITTHGSRDYYRLGKSIRKKGLDTEALLGGLDDLAARATARLADWIATDAAVSIDTSGDATLTARRTWTCRLPIGVAHYPCGGTHVASLAQLDASTTVAYQPLTEGFLAHTRTAAPWH